jgi:hypothetical protein
MTELVTRMPALNLVQLNIHLENYFQTHIYLGKL